MESAAYLTEFCSNACAWTSGCQAAAVGRWRVALVLVLVQVLAVAPVVPAKAPDRVESAPWPAFSRRANISIQQPTAKPSVMLRFCHCLLPLRARWIECFFFRESQ